MTNNSANFQGTMLRAGDVRRLLVISRHEGNSGLAARFDAAYSKIKMRACYCSVFDECWLSDLETLHPQTVARCPEPAIPFVPSSASPRP